MLAIMVYKFSGRFYDFWTRYYDFS